MTDAPLYTEGTIALPYAEDEYIHGLIFEPCHALGVSRFLRLFFCTIRCTIEASALHVKHAHPISSNRGTS